MNLTQNDYDFAFRLEFVFFDENGKFLTQKTWQLQHRQGEVGKIYLLQARAVMISDEPHFEKLGEDYSRLILSVGGMIDDLACSCFDPTDEAAIHQQLVAYPLSFYVTLKPELIRLRLYVK